jgi:glyceraldehyde 3-phosphate dehydrogenase
MTRIGINGFGRIGRVALRAIFERYADRVQVVAINASDSTDEAGWRHLFKYDSVYGQCLQKLTMPFSFHRQPKLIPWRELGVEVVLECTGAFRDKESLSAHLTAGAKKVVVSAPAKGVKSYVLGVNDKDYHGSAIISNASCTTNCIAPITKIIHDGLGVQKALMSTVHAYTADQELVDGSHQDLRRGRSAAVNIVPTSTGAAKAVTEVLPQLKGLFDGLALRVPVVCGSLADLTFATTKRSTKEEVNQLLLQASESALRGIIAVTNEALVSRDILGNPASAIVDTSLTQVVDGDLVKIIAWYDNEYGYACRLVEEAIMVGQDE